MKQKKFIPVSCPVFAGNEKKYVNECLDSVWISSSGRFVRLFEESFAQFCSAAHAVSCNNGTSALHLALLALGVEPGDEVLVPTLTYVAAANVIRYCHAKPVLIDSEPRTMNMDPALVEAAITRKTRGIVAVHLYGHPADMDPILEIARRHGLFVVEDAAEAHGALYRGRKVGSLADAATFSFYGNKVLTTGQGGIVTTGSEALAGRLRLFRGQGGCNAERRYWHPVIGHNYRMTNIEAAIGLAQVECAETHMAARRRVAEWYTRHLAPLAEFVSLPVEEPWARHAFWMYTVLLRQPETDRDAFMQALLEENIETRPVFHPMHVIPAHREPGGHYPVAEDLARRGVSLPTHGLLEEEDIARIAGAIRAICTSAPALKR
ncbi:MAG: DegT/DnrJ/EryC1/StrS family aminotransferase [Acidobacteriota bacterium]